MDLINIEKSLKKLGLTPNEITIYIYLLKKGVSFGADIYKDNQLDKSSSYEALGNLLKKDLIYSIGEKRNQKYGAYPPEKLLEIVEHQESELKKTKENITSLMEHISEYAKQNYKSKHIRLIEGKDGFKTWAFDRLTAPEGSTIREISSNVVQEGFLDDRDDFINYSAVEMPKQRILKNLRVKALLPEEDLDKFPELKSIERTDSKLLKEVRSVPNKFNFELGCSLVTYGNTTALLRKFQGEFLGIMIDDSLITNLINSMFDIVWEQCKEVR